MEQANGASQEDLQKVINSITGGGAVPIEAAPTDTPTITPSPSAVTAQADAAAAQPEALPELNPAEIVSAEMPAAEPVLPEIPIKAVYGDPDLDRVKSSALTDLRPILEKIDIPPEKKFLIYKEIIEITEDKGCIEPAYNAAKQIEDETKRGECLIYVVEAIDKLGIPVEETEGEENK